MKRVAVTGANGFVGRKICATLDEAGHTVRAIVRSGTHITSTADVVETADLFAASHAELQDMLDGTDIVIHAAWYAKPGDYLHSAKNLGSLAGTLRLANAAMEVGVDRFVGLGTCYEYDFQKAEQTDAFPLAADAALGPTTLYGTAKAAAFTVLTDALATSQTDFVWCRLFYLFGDGEDPNRLIPYVLRKIAAQEPADLSDGTQIRDYMNVDDAGTMVVQAALASGQGPLNICSGNFTSVRDVIMSILPPTADRSLLRFGARPMRTDEPPRVVGRPGGLRKFGWDRPL